MIKRTLNNHDEIQHDLNNCTLLTNEHYFDAYFLCFSYTHRLRLLQYLGEKMIGSIHDKIIKDLYQSLNIKQNRCYLPLTTTVPTG